MSLTFMFKAMGVCVWVGMKKLSRLDTIATVGRVSPDDKDDPY